MTFQGSSFLSVIGCVLIALEAGAERQAKEGKLARVDSCGDPLPACAVARLGTIRRRQYDFICGIAFLPDGKTIVSRNGFGVIHFWDAVTGRMASSLPGAGVSGEPSTFALSRNGRVLIATGRIGGAPPRVIVWDIRAKKKLPVPDLALGNLRCFTTALSPDGSVLAVGVAKSLYVIDAAKTEVRFKIVHNDTACSAAFSPDGNLLASAEYASDGEKNPIHLWDVTTGKPVGKLKGHTGDVDRLFFSPDGKMLASKGRDGTIRLWNIHTKQEIRQFAFHALDIAISPDGKYLAACNFHGAVRLWDTHNGRLIREIRTPVGSLRCLAFSPDGKSIVTGGDSFAFHLWDVSTGQEVRSLSGHHHIVNTVRFSPDGKVLASCGSDQTARIWDMATFRQRHVISLGGNPMEGSSLPHSYLAFTPDGKLASAIPVTKGRGDDPSIHLVDTASAAIKKTFRERRTPLHAVSFGPDGETLATASDDGVRLWAVSSGKEVGLISPSDGIPLSFAFSPDRQHLAIGSTDSISLWHLPTRLCRHVINDRKHPCSVTFSPDGDMLASCAGLILREEDSSVPIREAATGSLIRSIQVPSAGTNRAGVHSMAFSPDGRLLATAGGDHTVRVWSLATGRQIAEFAGHTRHVLSVDFSPDGKMLASGSADSTILLWDTSGLKLDLPPAKHSADTFAACWTDLKATDAALAYRSLWSLVAGGDNAVRLLAENIRPVPRVDPARLRRWLSDLDSNDFSARETATLELTRLGSAIVPHLRQLRDAPPSLEVRKRVDAILGQIVMTKPDGEHIRQRRAIIVLEQIDSPAARDLLKKLAGGATGAALTRDATLALQRLERRAKRP